MGDADDRHATLGLDGVRRGRFRVRRPAANKLVSRTMDLRAMAVVTAAITAERFTPRGERVARAIGVVVFGAGLVLVVPFGR